jgi:hypothetical protein
MCRATLRRTMTNVNCFGSCAEARLTMAAGAPSMPLQAKYGIDRDQYPMDRPEQRAGTVRAGMDRIGEWTREPRPERATMRY